MSQFNFFNEINSALTMDGEITRGPLPRWQKKMMEASATSLNGSVNATRSVLSVSYNTSFSANPPTKTPGKNGEAKNKKTPTPSKGSKTPGGGDRFIPNRGTTNFELGHYLVRQIFAEYATRTLMFIIFHRSNKNRISRKMTRRMTPVALIIQTK